MSGAADDDSGGEGPRPVEGPWRGSRLVIDGELVARSENSIWIVRPDKYCRMPKTERGRPPEDELDSALDDLVWHDHQGVFLIDDLDAVRLRIVPTGRPEAAFGIVTGGLDILRGTALVVDARRAQR
jgi:hypothetical protein